jgi:hypothetical protein
MWISTLAHTSMSSWAVSIRCLHRESSFQW